MRPLRRLIVIVGVSATNLKACIGASDPCEITRQQEQQQGHRKRVGVVKQSDDLKREVKATVLPDRLHNMISAEKAVSQLLGNTG